ncbi:MAG: thymidylate synthase, partial [Methanomethylovorans sp.]
MKAVLIEADTISSAWSRLIYEIYKNGEDHKPDYSTGTRRLHATVVINDDNADQVNSFVPIGENLRKKYKEELTEEYADWDVSLPDDDR